MVFVFFKGKNEVSPLLGAKMQEKQFLMGFNFHTTVDF